MERRIIINVHQELREIDKEAIISTVRQMLDTTSPKSMDVELSFGDTPVWLVRKLEEE